VHHAGEQVTGELTGAAPEGGDNRRAGVADAAPVAERDDQIRGVLQQCLDTSLRRSAPRVEPSPVVGDDGVDGHDARHDQDHAEHGDGFERRLVRQQREEAGDRQRAQADHHGGREQRRRQDQDQRGTRQVQQHATGVVLGEQVQHREFRDPPGHQNPAGPVALDVSSPRQPGRCCLQERGDGDRTQQPLVRRGPVEEDPRRAQQGDPGCDQGTDADLPRPVFGFVFLELRLHHAWCIGSASRGSTNRRPRGRRDAPRPSSAR
jgi:hypothetical protein